MPPEKRMRLENCAGVVNGIDLTHNGLQTVVEEVNFTAITAGQGKNKKQALYRFLIVFHLQRHSSRSIMAQETLHSARATNLLLYLPCAQHL